MKLKSLTIYANYSSAGYHGSAHFEGPSGEVKLPLKDSLGAAIVTTCLDAIHEAITEAATITKEQLLQGGDPKKEIEHDSQK